VTSEPGRIGGKKKYKGGRTTAFIIAYNIKQIYFLPII